MTIRSLLIFLAFVVTTTSFNLRHTQVLTAKFENETTNACSQYSECGSCVDDRRCGWCASNNKCTVGGTNAPKTGTCSNWQFNYCPGDSCTTYPSCRSCVIDPYCGWCGGMTADEIGGQMSPCVSGGKAPDLFCPSGYVHSPIAPGVQESVVNRYANEHMEHIQALCESEGVPAVASAIPDVPAVTPPLVFSASPDRGPHWGTTWISVGGAFFKENSVAYIGDVPCDRTIFVSPSVLKCLAPKMPRGERNRFQIVVVTGHLNSKNSTGNAAPGVIGDSELRKLRQQSEKTAYFTYDVLDVTRLDPSVAPTNGGTTLTLHGKGFGSRDHSAKVDIGGKECLLTRYVSDSEMLCVTPPGIGTELPVMVEVDGTKALGSATFSYAIPFVERAEPSSGPSIGGTRITVTGKNFGPKGTGSVVTLDDVPCVMSEQVSHEIVICETTRGLGAQLVVGVNAKSIKSNNTGVRFSYNAPSIHHISPNTGPASGHVVIAIHGENLASGFMHTGSPTAGKDSKRVRSLVKSGNFNSELAEYMRRVMGSNDGVEDLDRVSANATSFCNFCVKNSCAATLFCERLCAPQCAEAEEKKRKSDVSNAVSSKEAELWTKHVADIHEALEELKQARESKDIAKISVATERLNKLRAPEEENSIDVHADLAGVIAAASLSPSQVTRIRGVREALVKAMRGPWQQALRELSEASATGSPEDVEKASKNLAAAEALVEKLQQDLAVVTREGKGEFGNETEPILVNGARRAVAQVYSDMESLANASANVHDLQDKVQSGKSVNAQDTLDAAMGRMRSPVEDDSEISRVLGDVESTAKSVQLNTSDLQNNIENARKPDEEAPAMSPTDDALPTMESKDKKESSAFDTSFLEILSRRLDRMQRANEQARSWATPPPSEQRELEVAANETMTKKSEGEEGKIREWVGNLLGKIRDSGVSLDETDGVAVNRPPSKTGNEPLWKDVLEAQLEAERRDYESARLAPATARDWASAVKELYGPASDVNRTLDRVWQEVEKHVRLNGKGGYRGANYDYRYPEGWICDDVDFSNGPNASGCCPEKPPENGWEACEPHEVGKFCPLPDADRGGNMTDYCISPTKLGYNLGSLPQQCFGSHGLEQLASCDPLGNYSILWSCDELRRSEICLEDVRLEVCPQLHDLVKQESEVVSHMLDLRGCSLQGHSVASLNPSMKIRRAVRYTEAEAAKRAAIASSADSVAHIAEERQRESQKRVDVALQALLNARSQLADLLPVCNETLSWPPQVPEGASAEEAIVQPETACGAGCSADVSEEQCFASAASPQLQTECGLGLYGTSDSEGCQHLVESAAYKICHGSTKVCVAAESLTTVILSDKAFPEFAAQGFTPVRPETSWSLSRSGNDLWTMQPKIIDGDVSSTAYCLADNDGESMGLSSCTSASSKWSLEPVMIDGETQIGRYRMKSESTGRCWGVRVSNRCQTVQTTSDGNFRLALRNAKLESGDIQAALIVEVQTDQEGHIGLVGTMKSPGSGDSKCPPGYKLNNDREFCCVSVNEDDPSADDPCQGAETLCALPDAKDDLGYSPCGDSVASIDSESTVFHGPSNIRLTGGSNEYRGAVQILDDITEEWHSVCGDEEWDMDDATTVCRSLGLGKPVEYTESEEDDMSIDSEVNETWYSLNCSGTEQSFKDCEESRKTTSCEGKRVARIECSQPSVTDVGNMYEIIVTAVNSQIRVRRWTDGEIVAEETVGEAGGEGFLSPLQSRKFWISADEGVIRVGRGGTPGSSVAAEWTDPTNDPLHPISVVVKTPLDSEEASWKLCAPIGCPQNPDPDMTVGVGGSDVSAEQCESAGKCFNDEYGGPVCFEPVSSSSGGSSSFLEIRERLHHLLSKDQEEESSHRPSFKFLPFDTCEEQPDEAVWTLNYIGIYDEQNIEPGAAGDTTRAIERLEERAIHKDMTPSERLEILEALRNIQSKGKEIENREKALLHDREVLENVTKIAVAEREHSDRMQEEARKASLTSRASFGLAAKNVSDMTCGRSAVDYTPHGAKCVGVAIGGVDCLETAIVSDTLLTCILPPGRGERNLVTAIVDGQNSATSSPVLLFQYERPEVERIYPTHAPVIGHGVVQIYGRNFGAVDYKPEAWIGGVKCESTLWLSDTQMECRVPVGIGSNHSVVVEVGGQRSLARRLFEYDAPLPEALFPKTGPTRGNFNITIGGRNFGYEDHGVEVLLGDKPCVRVIWLSDSAIQCTVPPGSGQDMVVRVRVGDRWSTSQKLKFSYAGPVVHSVSPGSCDTKGGCRIKISGENYGTMRVSSLKAYIGSDDKFGKNECEDLKFINSTMLQCKVPPGVGVDQRVWVELTGRKSDPNFAFSYNAPLVMSVTPSNGPPRGGTKITVRGRYFGTAAHGQTIQFQKSVTKKRKRSDNEMNEIVQCEETTWHSDTMMTCVTPQAEGFDLAVIAKVGGQLSDDESDVMFSYDAPLIAMFEPAVGSTMGGALLTVRGVNLSPSVSVVIGTKSGKNSRGGECGRVDDRKSYNELKCEIPKGVGADFEVSLRLNGRLLRQSADELPYLGCFNDCKGGQRDLSVVRTSEDSSTEMTPDLCADLCGSQYKFIGVQGGDKCFCGNSYGSQFKAKPGMCSEPCAGNSVRMCGGQCVNSIFHNAKRQKGTRVLVSYDEKTREQITKQKLPSFKELMDSVLAARGMSANPDADGCDMQLNAYCRETLKKPWAKTAVARKCPVEKVVAQNLNSFVQNMGGATVTSNSVRANKSGRVSIKKQYQRPFSVEATIKGDSCFGMTFNSRKVNDVYKGSSIITNFWDGEFARLSSNYQNSAPKSTNRFVRLTRRNCAKSGYDTVKDTSSCLRAAKNLNLRLNTEVVSVDRSSSGLKGCVYSTVTRKLTLYNRVTNENSEANFRNYAICMYKSSETFTPRLRLEKGWNSVKIVAQSNDMDQFFVNGNKIGELRSDLTSGYVSFFGTCGSIEIQSYTEFEMQSSRNADWHCTDSSSGASGMCKSKSVRDGVESLDIEGAKSECKAKTQAQPLHFSYKRPVVNRVTPRNGPTLGGRLVTIYGKEFGEAKHPSTVYVRLEGKGLVECERSEHLTDKVVTCETPEGGGRARGVVVSVGNQQSEELKIFDYDPPVVTHIEPTQGHTYGGYNLTIEGQNFGVDQAVSVQVGNVPCCEVQRISDAKLVCKMSAGFGTNLKVVVDHLGNRNSDGPRFSFDAPRILAVAPATATPGTDIMLYGSDLGWSVVRRGNKEATCGAMEDEEENDSSTPIFQHPERESAQKLKLKQIQNVPSKIRMHATFSPPLDATSIPAGDRVIMSLGKNGDGKCGEFALFYRDMERPAKDTGLVARAVCAKSGMSASTLSGGLFEMDDKINKCVKTNDRSTLKRAFKTSAGDSLVRFSDVNFGSGDFTVSVWIKAVQGRISSNMKSEFGTLFMRGSMSNNDGVTARLYNDGRVEFRTRARQDSTVTLRLDRNIWSSWHHLSFVRSSRGLEIFVDGVSRVKKQIAIFNSDVRNVDWTFGSNSGPSSGAEENLNAWIQDVRMYDRALDSKTLKDSVMKSVSELFDGKGQFGIRTLCDSEGSDMPLLGTRVVSALTGSKIVDATYDGEKAKIYVNGKLNAEASKVFYVPSSGYVSLGGAKGGGTVGGSYVANAALYSSIEMSDERTLPEVSVGGKLCRFTERVPSPETWLPSSPTWTDAFSSRHRSSQLSNIGCQGPVTHLFDGGVCSWVSARAPGGSNPAEWVAFDTMRTVTVTKIRVAAGSPEGAPRNFKLQVSNSLDGAWRDVLSISDAERTTKALQYEVKVNTTSRFYRFVVSATQDRNTAVNLRSLMMFGGPANVVSNRLEALRCRVPVGSGQKASIRVRTMGVQAGVSSDLTFGFAPRDCLVSDFTEWSDCSRDCVGLGAANGHSHTGAGQTKRTRRVLRQEENGGRSCPSLEEVKSCNSDKTCPVHCAYDEWTPWTPAIISKGETMTHTRQILRSAAHGGDACDGNDEETFECPSGVCRDGKRDVEFENAMQVWLRPSSIMVVDEDKSVEDKFDSLDSFEQNWKYEESSSEGVSELVKWDEDAMHSDCHVTKPGFLEKTGSSTVNTWAWTCQAYSKKEYEHKNDMPFTLSFKCGCGMNKQYANIGLIRSDDSDWPTLKSNIRRKCNSNSDCGYAYNKGIDFGFDCRQEGLYIHEDKREMKIKKSSYASTDLFKLVVDGNTIKWYQNNKLLHSETKTLSDSYKVFALVHNTRNGNDRCNAFEDVSVSVESTLLKPLMIPKSETDALRFRENAEFFFSKSLKDVAKFVDSSMNALKNAFKTTKSKPEWTTVVEMQDRKVKTDVGKEKFNELFDECGVVRYTRSGANSVYKRLASSLSNPYDLFTNNWFSSKNVLNKDFEIYDSESDLRSSKNRWTFCNYDDPGIGYPRDCGKNHAIGNTWFSMHRAPPTQLSKFEIYTGSDCPAYSTAPKVEKEMRGLMSTEGAMCSTIPHKNVELGLGYFEMVLSNLKGSAGFVLSSSSSEDDVYVYVSSVSIGIGENDKVNFNAETDSVYTLGVHVTSQGVSVLLNGQVKLIKDITIKSSALKIRSCGQALISGLEAVETKRVTESKQQVVEWHDDSGKGHNALVLGLDSSPTVSMSTEESAQLRLDTTSGLKISNFSLSDSYDIFLDLRYILGGRGRLFDSATSRENWLCGAWAGRNGYHDSDLGWIGTPTNAEDSKWTVAECSLDGGDHEFKLNGVSKAKLRDTRGRKKSIPLAIGYVPGASYISTEKSPGEFRNVLIFKGGSLSQEQRDDVERYLSI